MPKYEVYTKSEVTTSQFVYAKDEWTAIQIAIRDNERQYGNNMEFYPIAVIKRED